MIELPKNAASRLSASAQRDGYKAVKLHEYTDRDGNVLYWKLRMKHPVTGKKWMRPMHFNGSDYELKDRQFGQGRTKPLYRLHLLAADLNSEVWFFEGELKVDEAEKRGLLATTSGGATSLSNVDLEALRGRTVIIWPDNNDPGLNFAGELASLLLDMGCKVSSIDIQALGIGEDEDFGDWVKGNQSATKQDIEVLPRREALKKDSSPLAVTVTDLHDLLAKDIQPPKSILGPWLLEGNLCMVHAWRGTGKSLFTVGAALAIATGSEILGWKAPQSKNVLIIDGELPEVVVQERVAKLIRAMKASPDRDRVRFVTLDSQPLRLMPNLATPDGQEALRPAIDSADVIIVDNLSCLVRNGRDNEVESWQPMIPWLLGLRSLGKSILLVHHSNKNGKQRGTSAKEDLLDGVICLRRPEGMTESSGCTFELHFEKARHFYGPDAEPFLAQYSDENGWTREPLPDDLQTFVKQKKELGMTRAQIAREAKVHRSTVGRLWEG